MPIRVIGYDGAAYRAQLSSKERYPVVTLVLYYGEKPWGRHRTLYDMLDIPEALKPFVHDYGINVIEVAHLSEEVIANFHSDFRIVLEYFIHKDEDPEYWRVDPHQFQHAEELITLLGVLMQDNRYFETLDQEGDRPKNMCELLDRVEARGEAKGRAEGESKLAALIDKLFLLGRMDDARKAVRDESYRAMLFHEFKIV